MKNDFDKYDLNISSIVGDTPKILEREIMPTLQEINKALVKDKKLSDSVYTKWGKTLMTIAAPHLLKKGIKLNISGKANMKTGKKIKRLRKI